jgi:tetratricopeptide (TPR) repeat protein
VRSYVGDHAVAIRHLERAMALNPLDPEIAYVLTGLAFAHLGLGRAEEALALARRALLAQPAFAPTYSALLWAFGLAGRWEEARALAPRFMARRPGFRISAWRDANPWVDERFRAKMVEIYERAGLPP